MRPEADVLAAQLFVQSLHGVFQPRARERKPQVAEPQVEQRLVLETRPRGFATARPARLHAPTPAPTSRATLREQATSIWSRPASRIPAATGSASNPCNAP